jgi:hypothetical protein
VDQILNNLWVEYRAAVEAVYLPEDGWAFDPESDQEALQRVAELSEAITRRLENPELMPARPPADEDHFFPLEPGESTDFSRDVERNELEGVAGVDCVLGATIMREWGDQQEAIPPENVPLLPPAPSAAELPSMDFLLWKAGQAFGESVGTPVGAQTSEETAASFAFESIDRLIVRGSRPVVEYGLSLASLGATAIAGAGGAFAPWDEIVDKLGGRLHFGSRLIRSAIKKLARVVGSREFLKEAYSQSLEQLGGTLPLSFDLLAESAVGWLVREAESRSRVEDRMEQRTRPMDLRKLEVLLEDLCDTFSDRMQWARTIHIALRVASVAVAIASLGAGHAAVVAAYGVGFVVCLFMLADRLDTIPGGIGFVAGVPSIVAKS